MVSFPVFLLCFPQRGSVRVMTDVLNTFGLCLQSDDAKAALKVLQDMEIDPSDGKVAFVFAFVKSEIPAALTVHIPDSFLFRLLQVEVKEMEEKLKEWNESSLQG